MFGLGPWELIIIGILLFVIFGAKRIPEIGKGLGGAVREFKSVKRDLADEKADAGSGRQETEDEEARNEKGLESQVAGKLLEQVPGVKRAMGVKKKVDRVRKAVK